MRVISHLRRLGLLLRLLLCVLLIEPASLHAQSASPRAPLVAGRPESDWRDDLRNPQGVVRQAAIEALVQFSEISSASLAEIVPLIGDPDVAVRRTAIRAIGRSGAAAKRAQPALWRAWSDEDPLVSADAGIALVQLHNSNTDEFRRRLRAADGRERARAAAALANGGQRARRAIHALRDCLNDADSRVRGGALAALNALDLTPGSRTATLVGKSLERELTDSPQLDALDALARARVALALLTRAGKDARGATRPLTQLLWDGPAPLRTTAAQTLGRINGAGDQQLSMAIAAGDERVRDAALVGLLADRARRRALTEVLDSLPRVDPLTDSTRVFAMVDALGYVGQRNRRTNNVLDALLKRAPTLAPRIATARRRLAIGF